MSKIESPALTINEVLSGQYDAGLGLCLQCVAEYKVSGQQPDMTPRWAVTLAPIVGNNGVGGTCYEHLNVQPPQPMPPQRVPMTPQEQQAMSNLLMPNGQPVHPRHAR